MPNTKPSYDIAFSLTSKDTRFVKGLVAALPEFECFFYPEKQRVLVGNTALGPMRRAFRYDSKLQVIVLRDPWGKTGYTKLEDNAICDRYFAIENAPSPFLIRMDKSYPKPEWIPDTVTWCLRSDYKIKEIADQIREKFETLIVVPRSSTRDTGFLTHLIVPHMVREVRRDVADEITKRVEIGKRKQAREHLLKTSDGYDLALAYMNSLLEEFNAEIPFLMGFDSTMNVKWTKTSPPPTWFVMSTPKHGVAIKWERDGGPSVRDDRLIVEFYKDPITVPGQMEIPFYWHREPHRGPRIVRKLIYKADFNLAGAFMWKSGEEVFDFDALVGFIMNEFHKFHSS